MHAIKQWLERRWAEQYTSAPLEERDQAEAQIRAHAYTGYKHVPACSTCDLQAVCDGFHSDYSGLFGSDEARPVVLGARVTNPQHFSRHQLKKIHPEG